MHLLTSMHTAQPLVAPNIKPFMHILTLFFTCTHTLLSTHTLLKLPALLHSDLHLDPTIQISKPQPIYSYDAKHCNISRASHLLEPPAPCIPDVPCHQAALCQTHNWHWGGQQKTCAPQAWLAHPAQQSHFELLTTLLPNVLQAGSTKLDMQKTTPDTTPNFSSPASDQVT